MERFDTSVTGAQYLLTHPNGNTFKVSAEMRDLLELFDGRRSTGTVAAMYAAQSKAPGQEPGIVSLIDSVLAAKGILRSTDAPAPQPAERKSAVSAFLYRRDLIQPRAVETITGVTKVLFQPGAAALLVVFAGVCYWSYYSRGAFPRPSTTMRAVATPAVYFWLLLSILAHEVGHASAVRFFGRRPGAIGFGFFLLFPVFYNDVSSIWTLRRSQRAVVDLAGVYFQALVTACYMLVYMATGWRTIGLAIVAINLTMVYNLLPALKFDGYWLYADLIGVPDLYDRLRHTNRNWWKWLMKKGNPARVLQGVTSRSVATAVYAYFALAYVCYFLLLFYVFKKGTWLVHTYPGLLLHTLNSVSHVATLRDAQRAFSDILVLLLSSNLIVWIALIAYRRLWPAALAAGRLR